MLSADTVDLESRTVFREWNSYRSESHRSLTRARGLAEQLDIPGRLKDVPTVGVVGSKGKGTAALFASAALSAAGLKVGTILSPGVVTNLDRVLVDGRSLREQDYRTLLLLLDDELDRVTPVDVDDGYLSPTGLFMLLGLREILDQHCDVVVIEAGLGGLSDELSLFPLSALVITQIFGEHREILGPTIADIARDKSGVMTSATSLVYYLSQLQPAESVIVKTATALGIVPTRIDETVAEVNSTHFPPGYSRMNAAIGTAAGVAVGEFITGEEHDRARLSDAIASVTYPGRLSVHSFGETSLVVDSAISRNGLVSALEFARLTFGQIPSSILVSLGADKDLDGFIRELRTIESRIVFVDFADTHLTFPDRTDWPWEWADISQLPDLLVGPNVLAVGTISFSSKVLELVGVDTDHLFVPPPGKSG